MSRAPDTDVEEEEGDNKMEEEEGEVIMAIDKIFRPFIFVTGHGH